MNVASLSAGFRHLFYAVTPNETSFESPELVPDYVKQATPYFFVLIVVETGLLWLQGKPLPRVEDALASISAGVVSRLQYLLKRATEMVAYMYVWEHYRLYELPWDSSWTWWLCLIGVDFCYYWVHRMAHEVNFMWAAHQVHHSSEDYNLTTALRQSALQNYSSWIFYVPLALVAPPSLFYVHSQFNLLYQFWIHTEVIDNLGPLEYVLNTPSHHRVHHGRNRYCIDANYGGTLIIFDRIFGTFKAEKKEDAVVYGLVHPLESTNPIYIQLCHWQYIIQMVWATPGITNKLSVLLKGPGWSPGKPRLGDIEDIPDIHFPQPKYSTSSPRWYDVYVVAHFFFLMIVNEGAAVYAKEMSPSSVLLAIAYVLVSLTALGSLYDARWYALWLESLRCLVTAVAFCTFFASYSESASPTGRQTLILAAAAMFVLSALLWVHLMYKSREELSNGKHEDERRHIWPLPLPASQIKLD